MRLMFITAQLYYFPSIHEKARSYCKDKIRLFINRNRPLSEVEGDISNGFWL